MTQKILTWAKIVACLAFTGFLVATGLIVLPHTSKILNNISVISQNVRQMSGEAQSTSTLLLDCKISPHTCIAPRLTGTLRAIEVSSGELSKSAKEITAVAKQLPAIAQSSNEQAQRTIQELTTTVQSSLQQGTGAITGIREDLQPTLQHVASLTEQINVVAEEHLNCVGNGKCWPEAITATLGGVKILTGEAGQAARRIDGTLPELLVLAQHIGENSDKTTAESAKTLHATTQVMQNFAEATKPIPKWLRIVLQAGPPVAEMGAAVVAAGVALSWLP